MANHRKMLETETDDARLLFCDRCGVMVTICRSCDRGNRYCGSSCSTEARRESHRAANRRYQATTRGRQLHAACQARYRRRKGGRIPGSQNRVTDQGRDLPARTVHEVPQTPNPYSCQLCNKKMSGFLRVDPLLPRRRSPTLAFLRAVSRSKNRTKPPNSRGS